MPNELTTTPSQWTPPQAKWVRRIVTGGGIFLLVALAAQIVHKTVPTITSAVDLLAKLTSSLTWLAIDGAVLATVVIVLYQIFSPQGAINKLISLKYAGFINRLTWSIIDDNPMIPYYQRKKELAAQRITYDAGFSELDGVIVQMQKLQTDYASEARQHEARAKAANTKGMDSAFNKESYAYKRCTDQAQKYKLRAESLVPMREDIRQVQSRIDEWQENLDMDIRLAEEDIRISKSVAKVSAAGRSILTKTDSWELAQKAQQIIDEKYSNAMGDMKNLTTTVRPLLDSVNLDEATVNEELLAKWREDSQKLLSAPVSSAQQQQPVTNSFRNLLG